jgi:dipeptidase D
MGKEILKLEPKDLWKIFYDFTQIPRPSKYEDRVQAFALNFGKDLGLESIRDTVGNIIIRKPATKGMENRQGVILQAHLDMVPQKNSATRHDFEQDPIDAFIDGQWVKAKGTTLGSDNGIGASAAMAVLKSTDISHGPIEVLLTCDEETGMTGAVGLKPGLLKGDILLNLDSEDEGELYVGCAGGVNTNAVIPFKPEEVPPNCVPYRIGVTGLKGGHSGLDIHLGRGNANKIMNQFLMRAAEKFGLRLATIEGGNLRNAIPREAFAVVVVPESAKETFKEFAMDFEKEMKKAFEKADPGLLINTAATKMPAHLIGLDVQQKLLKAIDLCPNEVISWSKEMPGIVETSTNLAIVKSGDGVIEFASLQRSSIDAEKDDLAKKIAGILTEAGAKADISGNYPGWKPNFKSPILTTMKEVYLKRFGKTPEVKVIHAGLECGILGSHYPNWDMISFGPTIRSPHSPDERVNIETVGMFWEYLLETLKNVPGK